MKKLEKLKFEELKQKKVLSDRENLLLKLHQNERLLKELEAKEKQTKEEQ